MKMGDFMLAITIVFMICAVVPLIKAEQTVKTVEYPVGYIAQTVADNDYTKNINVQSPDGISDILSLEIKMMGDFQANTGISARTNIGGSLVACEPSTWTTPNIDTPNYNAIFDCTDLINQYNWKGGSQLFGFRTDKIAQNVYGNMRITYYNKPKTKMDIHGTEYLSGQDGKIFLQILDDDSLPVSNSTCFASIYYPNNDIWKYQQLMTYLDEGLYTYDFETPLIQGVYPVSAFCTLPELAFEGIEVSDDFESGDGNGGSGWLTNWTIDDCEIQGVYYQDGSYALECEDDMYPLRTIQSNVSYERLDYDFWYRATGFAGAEYVNVRILDADSTPHILQVIDSDIDDGTWRRVTGSLDVTVDSFNFDGTITFDMDASGGLNAGTYYYLDTIVLTLNEEVEVNATEYEIVRGSGEVHVSSDSEYTAQINYGTLTNETFDGYFYLYYDVYSGTQQNKLDIDVQLPIFNAFPCEEVQEVFIKNETEDWESIPYSKQLLGNRNDRCAVHIDLDLGVNEVKEVYIKLTNFWRLELLGRYEEATINKNIINDGCVYYQQAQSLTNFSIPLTSRPTEDDEFWLSCQYYFQVYWDFNKTITEQFVLDVASANFTEQQMGELEGIYLNLLQEANLLREVTYGIINAWQQSNDYPGAILGGGSQIPYLTFFANVSGNQMNYYEILKNRIETEEVAEEVWNYNETINPNIISQFTSAIWTMLNSTYNFINMITESVWTRADRNLTFYETPNVTASVNTTEIADAIWNNTERTLTGQEQLWVGGTEYSPDEEYGKIVIRLVNALDFPVEGADCNLTIFYPNNTRYLEMVMPEYEPPGNETGVGGIYLADFNHSGVIGVHPYGIDCYAEVGTTPKRFFLLDTYHVYGANYTKQAENVWNYPERNISTTEDVTNYTSIQEMIDNIPAQVDLTNYTYIQELIIAFGNNNTDLTNYTLMQNLISAFGNDDVANYTLIEEIVTAFGNDDTANYTLIQDLITQYGNDDVTNYTEIQNLITQYGNQDNTNYTLIQELITQYGNYDATNYTLIVELIAQYSNNLTSEQIWQFNNRTLSSFEFVVEADVNSSLISENIWSYFNRTLTQDFLDLTNYTLIESLINQASSNLTAEQIWNFQSRNLSYTEFQDLTNYSLVQQIVTTYGNNLSITPEQIWEFENRTLSEFNFTVEADVNSSLISENIWSHFNRTLTQEFPDQVNYTQIQELIEAFANNITAEDIWLASNRTLTFVPDVSNYTLMQELIEDYGNELSNLTASEIWSYGTRELSYYPTTNLTLSNDSIQALGNAVWSYSGTIHDNIITQFADKFECYVDRILFENGNEWGVEISNC